MNIIFKRLMLAISLTSALAPLNCLATNTNQSGCGALKNIVAHAVQEQRKNLFVSTLAAAKKFVASKTRFQLAVATGWLALMGVTAVSMGLLLTSLYYEKSNRQLAIKLSEIAVWPVTMPRTLFHRLYYGEFKREEKITKFAAYSDLNKNIADHNFVDESFETKIKKIAENSTNFVFSIKTNKYNKESYCFIKKGSTQSKTTVSEEQKKKTKTENVNTVNIVYNNNKDAKITPDDTLIALEKLLSNPTVHTIIVNKSGLSYKKYRKIARNIITKREFDDSEACDSNSHDGSSGVLNSYSPIKIELIKK